MKMITAVIKPHCLDAVRKGLVDLGVTGMTVLEAQGFGRQKGHTELYRGSSFEIQYLPKVKIEVAIEDSMVDPVIECIIANANTGKIGDGKIFVFPLEQVVRIRTGEIDSAAI